MGNDHFGKVVDAIEATLLRQMQMTCGIGAEPIQEGSPLLRKMATAAAHAALNNRDYLY